MSFKKLLAILIILPILLLTGCWDSHEINTLAIVIATGIDKTDKGYLITQQVLNPKAIASKRATNEATVVLYSEEGEDLFEIYRKITTESPRKIYNLHLRMIVFGESMAKEGIKEVLDFYTRDHEFRTDFYFVVAKNTTANKVLSILTPIETIPGIEMSDSLEMSESVWAPTKSTKIIELVNSIIAEGKSPVLTGVEVTTGVRHSDSTTALTITGDTKRLKYTNLGAFKKDKLIGWLNEEEAKGYNYIINNVKNTVGYADYGNKVKITYEVKKAKSTIKASLVDGKPSIDVEIKLKCNIAMVEGEFDVSKEENKKTLEELAEKRAITVCEKAVKKAQKDLKTDIFGFGEAIHRKYPKLWEEIKADWSNEFENLPVNITANVQIKQLGQITKPFYIKEKE